MVSYESINHGNDTMLPQFVFLYQSVPCSFPKKLVGDGTINIILYFTNFVNCENTRLQIIVSLEL